VHKGSVRCRSGDSTWLIVAISDTVESGGRDWDVKSVGSGNADQCAEIGVGRRDFGIDLGERCRGAARDATEIKDTWSVGQASS
jgi:hypothetical protein